MKCPNCGATLDYVDENIIKCPYCATKHANTEFRKTDSGDLGDLMEKVFQDSDGNGVPDVFEGDGVTKIGTTYVTVNGKPLNDMEELPDNIKEIVGGLGNDNFANISKIQISQSQPQQASTPDKLEDDFQYRELKELLSQAKPGKAYPLGLVILLVTGIIYLIIAIMIIRAVPSNTFAPFAIGLAGFSLASVLYFFSNKAKIQKRAKQMRIVNEGKRTEAKIVDTRSTMSTGTSGTIYVHKTEFEIYPESGNPYSITKRMTLDPVGNSSIEIGKLIEVFIDPTDKEYIVWTQELKCHPEFIRLLFKNRYL